MNEKIERYLDAVQAEKEARLQFDFASASFSNNSSARNFLVLSERARVLQDMTTKRRDCEESLKSLGGEA